MAKSAQETAEQTNQQDTPDASGEKTQVKSVQFTQAAQASEQPGGASLDILLDMNIQVNVTVGRIDISVRRLLQLGPGSVVILDKSVDEPVDLYLKGSKFATGDIVVVDDKFAVRVRQILPVASQTGEKTPETAKKDNEK
jgi:flagellar motor switch protein FliN/FliY